MTSHDVRDMLNLPVEGTNPRPTRKGKAAGPRSNLRGLAREVQSLGGDNPIAIVPEISPFKKRRFSVRKPAAKWELRPFRNSARDDQSLVLTHWRRQTIQPAVMKSEAQEAGPVTGPSTEEERKTDDTEDSSFAKFNVQAQVPIYTADQYDMHLKSDEWTKAETDYLMAIAKDYDLRWPLIWDRYEYVPRDSTPSGQDAESSVEAQASTSIVVGRKARSLEDLKARYYDVASRMMVATKPVQYMTQEEYELHEVMTRFDAVGESRRKKFASDMMSRSKEEAREEEALLIEVRRILQRTEKFNRDRFELYNRLDLPHTEPSQDVSAFRTSAAIQSLLQNLMAVDKSKKRKPLTISDGLNTPASAGPSSALPTSTPVADHNRRESIAASVAGHRDSIGSVERPDKASKKSALQLERRKLTEQEEQIYGVSTGERLGAGPTFRYERINKILTTKSNAQSQRISNTLAELDIPLRPNMATTAVISQMEKLLNNINTLLDLRKLGDRLDGELKVEQAKKAEKDRRSEPQSSAPGPEAQADASAATTVEVKPEIKSDGAGAGGSHPDGEKTAEDAEADAVTVAPQIKHEASDEKPANERNDGHKRSASVTSAGSTRSKKRQKK